MSSLYQFPVSKPVHAMKVTSPDFQVDLLGNNLYINFDEVRSTVLPMQLMALKPRWGL
jgi:hypothetical protein